MAKTKSKRSETSKAKFSDYLTPTFIVCCQDIIVGQDKMVSLLRLVDSFMSQSFPAAPIPRLLIVAELRRNLSIPIKDLYAAKLRYSLKLVTPDGEEQLLSKFGLPVLEPAIPWESTKTMHNGSGTLSFKAPGTYLFRLTGQVDSGPEERLAELPFPAKQAPSINGDYKAEIETPAGKESATVTLLNGVISGTGKGVKLTGVYGTIASKVLADVTIQSLTESESRRIRVQGDVDAHSIKLSGVLDAETKVEIVLRKLAKSSVSRKSR